MTGVGTPLLWIGFTLFVLGMLGLDLIVFNRKTHKVKMRESLAWCAVWIGLAMAFNLGVWHFFGAQRALEFLTGYLIEEALSVDNLFVFLVIFSFFKVTAAHQHRVLFWGILGAIVLRAVFIFAGVALLDTFHWLIFVFGGFLIFTGIKILIKKEEEVHPDKNFAVKLLRRLLPMTDGYREHHFFVHEGGRRLATPLLLVLVTVEATDLVFAVDSIPAVLAVTKDPFIVYTSNIFAVLGLRALFFVLSGALNSMRYLKYGLGLVLVFVGFKMVVADGIPHFHIPPIHIPVHISLAVVAGLLGTAVAASLLKPASP